MGRRFLSADITAITTTAAKGGQWGVFASNIHQSMGYQCLPCYRETVIPRDLIFDPRFRLTPGGRAVFVG